MQVDYLIVMSEHNIGNALRIFNNTFKDHSRHVHKPVLMHDIVYCVIAVDDNVAFISFSGIAPKSFDIKLLLYTDIETIPLMHNAVKTNKINSVGLVWLPSAVDTLYCKFTTDNLKEYSYEITNH